MDRQVFKFRFSEMEQVLVAYNDYRKAMYSERELLDMSDEEMADDIMRNITMEDVNKINSAMIKFASILVPIGLRLKSKEMENIGAVEGIKYLYEILEMNRDFFIELGNMGLNIPEKIVGKEAMEKAKKMRKKLTKKKQKTGKE